MKERCSRQQCLPQSAGSSVKCVFAVALDRREEVDNWKENEEEREEGDGLMMDGGADGVERSYLLVARRVAGSARVDLGALPKSVFATAG
jgi:hypothetical protein